MGAELHVATQFPAGDEFGVVCDHAGVEAADPIMIMAAKMPLFSPILTRSMLLLPRMLIDVCGADAGSLRARSREAVDPDRDQRVMPDARPRGRASSAPGCRCFRSRSRRAEATVYNLSRSIDA